MTGRGKLSDAELSKKLGHYQKMSRIWILVGLFGALSGTVSYFAVQDTALKAILTGVLFFGGVCCAVFLGGSAQKKLQALIQEQFGDFFRAEWEKAFGPDMHTPEMCVDEPFLRTFHLLDGQWEECTVENFHEGDYRGVHFSAANVRLDHVYERGCGHEGYETCHEMVFKGLVLRCETQTPAPSPVLVNARTEDSPRGAANHREELAAATAALAVLQLARELFVCHCLIFFHRIILSQSRAAKRAVFFSRRFSVSSIACSDVQ